MPDHCEVVTFREAVELLDYVRLWRSEYWGDGVDHQWIFRGQASADWLLLPCAWRNPGSQVLAVARMQYKPVVERFVENFARNTSLFVDISSCQRSKVVDALTAYFSEREYTASFHRAAHRTLGTRRYNLADYAFCNAGVFFQSDHDWSDWMPDWADALAQHYGMPTRLLDWSRNPLAALSFLSFEQQVESDVPLSLWCMNIARLEPQDRVPYTWHMVPDYQGNENARQQGGVLTYVRHAEPYFMQKGEWPTHDGASHFAAGNGPPMRKLTLPPNQRAVLAELLLKEGWSLMALKPTLESVSKTVEITFPCTDVANVVEIAERRLSDVEQQFKRLHGA